MNPQTFKGYRASMPGGRVLDIFVYGAIGEGFGEDGVTSQRVIKSMQDAGQIDTVNLYISSPGGMAFEALSIVDILHRFRGKGGKVYSYIDSMAASAASILMCAADRIYCAQNSLIMIHQPFTFIWGNSDELRTEAMRLDKISNSIVDTYYAQTQKAGAKTSKQDLLTAMKAETWYDPAEAIEAGLVDEITQPMQAAASWDLSRFKYRNAPRVTHQAPATSQQEQVRAKLRLMQMSAPV